MTKENNEQFLLTGKAFWTHLSKPNEQSGSFQLDLSIDESTKKKLEDLGITVKNATKGIGVETAKKDDPRGDFVTLKKTAKGRDGTIFSPPAIVDGKKNPVSRDLLIGNGSEITAISSIYNWKFKSKSGKSLNLHAVQIKSLVEYKSTSGGLGLFKEEPNGFIAETTTGGRQEESTNLFE